jgi:rhodanese-related sulfurtransferase
MRYFLLGFLMTLISCSSNGQKNKVASTEEFEKAIASKNIQLLDVRTADEYKTGHIKNSLQANWLNKAEFEDRTSHLDKNKPVYIYCLSGGRSAAATAYLSEKGYDVTNLTGGITAWKQGSKPVEGVDPNTPQTTQASYEGQLRSNELVLVDFGADWCPPCKRMEPIIADFMKQQGSKVTLIKMDGGIETELMKSLKVEALPTFILYKNGVENKRKQGLVTLEEFTSWIQ